MALGFPKPRPQLLVRAKSRKAKERAALKVRQEVRGRDGWQCQSCHVPVSMGYENPLQHAHVHHIQFRSQGGPDTHMNLITVCAECHAKIHSHEITVTGTNANTVKFKKLRGHADPQVIARFRKT